MLTKQKRDSQGRLIVAENVPIIFSSELQVENDAGTPNNNSSA